MPWCPNCKTEYRDGVTVCVDCGSELVSEQPPEYQYVTLNVIEKQEVADRLLEYFEFSQIDCHYEYSEEELGYLILVRDEDLKKAKKTFQAFYIVEAEQLSKKETQSPNNNDEPNDIDNEEFELEDEEIEEIESKKALDSNNLAELEELALVQGNRKFSKMMTDGGAYEKKGDKSKELKSTAVSFFAFGFLGLLFVILNLVKVLDFLHGPIPYVVMSTMFIGFVLIGFNSVDRAKKAAKDAVQEEETTKQLTEWLDLTITNETLQTLKNPNLSEEANFISVMEGIKALVIKQFGEIDDAYLDYVTEEFYNNKFGC